jgi:hypothetical protein
MGYNTYEFLAWGKWNGKWNNKSKRSDTTKQY